MPKVVVELSQPEVRFVAPSRGCATGGPASSAVGTGPVAGRSGAGYAATSSKTCSFLNLNITRNKAPLHGGGVGGIGGIPQPVTTVVPAYATATIPISLQTTQFTTGVAQSALLGNGVGLSQTEAAALVRDLIRREAQNAPVGQAQSAQTESARTDSCAELKSRVDRIEQRLEQIEKKVDGIAAKLTKATDR